MRRLLGEDDVLMGAEQGLEDSGRAESLRSSIVLRNYRAAGGSIRRTRAVDFVTRLGRGAGDMDLREIPHRI